MYEYRGTRIDNSFPDFQSVRADWIRIAGKLTWVKKSCHRCVENAAKTSPDTPTSIPTAKTGLYPLYSWSTIAMNSKSVILCINPKDETAIPYTH